MSSTYRQNGLDNSYVEEQRERGRFQPFLPRPLIREAIQYPKKMTRQTSRPAFRPDPSPKPTVEGESAPWPGNDAEAARCRHGQV